jgi:hypothetical protein
MTDESDEKSTAPLEQRLLAAAHAVRTDIRGVFKGIPKYRTYLADILDEAANDIRSRSRAE